MSSNKTIAKNTLFLYFRMMLTMCVGLYTSRLVLETLGVVDYGIYGLVGGIVSMFAFLNSAMSSSTQRYLSFDIGKKDWGKLQKTFNATLNIHIGIAIVIFILAETIGLWFVNYKLDIPAERMYAVNWVYQFSIFTFIINVIQVPYNALLFAREHMSVYAYVSILETVLKLGIVLYLVQATHTDQLILYAILTFVVAFVIQTIYKLYCKKCFKESVYKFHWDKTYYKELMSYSGWNLFSAVSDISRRQGSNIILNLFYGPAVNAAYVLSESIYGIVSSFVNSVQTAFNPQIVKSYSNNQKTQTLHLVYTSSKFTFFSMLIIITPLIINVKYIINLWLGAENIPNYTTDFISLGLMSALLINMSNPMSMAVSATGKIRNFELINSSLKFIQILIVWFVLKVADEPKLMYYVFIIMAIVILFFKLIYIKIVYQTNLKSFLYQILRMVFVTITVVIMIYLFKDFLIENNNFILLLFKSLFISVIVLLLSFMIGVSKNEKKMVYTLLFNKIKNA